MHHGQKSILIRRVQAFPSQNHRHLWIKSTATARAPCETRRARDSRLGAKTKFSLAAFAKQSKSRPFALCATIDQRFILIFPRFRGLPFPLPGNRFCCGYHHKKVCSTKLRGGTGRSLAGPQLEHCYLQCHRVEYCRYGPFGVARTITSDMFPSKLLMCVFVSHHAIAVPMKLISKFMNLYYFPGLLAMLFGEQST